MGSILRQAVLHKNTIYHWLKIGTSIWMLFFVLLYMIFSNSIYLFVNNVAQITRIPWLGVQFIQVREFFLQFFTATYLF
jgi:hypothetical protein